MFVQKGLQVDISNNVNVTHGTKFKYTKGQQLLPYAEESDGSCTLHFSPSILIYFNTEFVWIQVPLIYSTKKVKEIVFEGQ